MDVTLSSAKIRILGVAAPRITDPRDKWSGLYRALGERFEVVGAVLSDLPRRSRYALLARHVRPSRAAWLARAGYDPRAFTSRTRALEPALAAWDGRYDLIVQLQTLFQPGVHATARPFVIYTDWTHALQARHFPGGLQTSARADRGRERLEAQTAQSARRVFTTSEVARRSFIDDYGCDPASVTAVGAGAVTFDRTPVPRAEGPPRALFVGYDFERKGGGLLLAAWPQVRRAVPEAELWIVGPPQPATAHDGVRWLGRADGYEALAELYRSATVLAMPSLLEPWGLVFHEAMGHGLPCIGADAFAMPEIIDDGTTGLLIPPGDEQALADALTELLADPARAAQMGEAARRRVNDHDTWAHVVERMAPALLAAV